jgi:hypothetical protein
MKLAWSSQAANLLLLTLLLLLGSYMALAASLGRVLGNGHAAFYYAGVVAVSISFLSYFIAPRFYKRLLGLTLLLALFGVVRFLPATIKVGLALGDEPVGIDLLVAPLVAAFYFLNRSSANAFLRRYIIPAPTPAQADQHRREAIDQFKQTFARRSDTNLQQLLHDPRLVGHAVTAAKELLAERGITNPGDI